jgi:hypothetical protein
MGRKEGDKAGLREAAVADSRENPRERKGG